MLRNGEQLLLAVVIPVIVLVGGVRGADRLGLDYDHPVVDVVTPGVLALAVMSTAFTSLAIATGFERRYGVLKRLGASPLPRSGLLLGKVGALLMVEVLQLLVISLVGARCSAGTRPRRCVGCVGARAGRAARHRGVRRARAAAWPARSAPRPRWPPPTSSTCCCSPAGRSCSPRRRTAPSATSPRWLPSGALGEAMRAAFLDGAVAWRDLARACSGGPSSATVLTARTFRWE